MMEAIILAGGLGTRLRARVADRPKPMAEVAGKPFLALLLDHLEAHGFTRVILSVGFKHEAIIDHFGARYRSLDLAYAIEDEPLGTGGAIVEGLAQATGNPVWVLNGDTFLALDFDAMRRHHRDCEARMTMAVRAVPDVGRYGAVEVLDGRVRRFATGQGAGLINSGVYLLSESLFDGTGLPRVFSFERDFLPGAVQAGLVGAFVTKAWFIDIGVPEDYDRAQIELPGQIARPHRSSGASRDFRGLT